MAVDDSNTKALLHLDGADGGAVFTDESGKTWTGVATAQTDTDRYKFATAALLLDGNSDYIYTANHADFDLSASDGAVDCWIYATSLGAADVRAIWGSADNTDETNLYVYPNGQLSIGIAGVNEERAAIGTITTDSWIHVAVQRTDSSGRTRVFVGGVNKIDTLTDVWVTPTKPMRIGDYTRGAEVNFWVGSIDEFRWSKGVIRYPGTTTFIPPSSPYAPPIGVNITGSGKVLCQGQSASAGTMAGDGGTDTYGNVRMQSY
jgi:hypothetical protein